MIKKDSRQLALKQIPILPSDGLGQIAVINDNKGKLYDSYTP